MTELKQIINKIVDFIYRYIGWFEWDVYKRHIYWNLRIGIYQYGRIYIERSFLGSYLIQIYINKTHNYIRYFFLK